MKVRYDREVDTLYISLKRAPAYNSKELSPAKFPVLFSFLNELLRSELSILMKALNPER